MNPNFNNPFESIVSQMNSAKSTYDQTMAGLQNQLKAIQQNMMQMQQNMYQPQMYQSPQPQPQMPNQPQEMQQPSPFEREMALLCEIKNGILKNNELLEQFFKGVPFESKEKDKKDESNKGKDKG